MERPRKQRLSDLLRSDLLPPPPLGRPLAAGGAAARTAIAGEAAGS